MLLKYQSVKQRKTESKNIFKMRNENETPFALSGEQCEINGV